MYQTFSTFGVQFHTGVILLLGVKIGSTGVVEAIYLFWRTHSLNQLLHHRLIVEELPGHAADRRLLVKSSRHIVKLASDLDLVIEPISPARVAD